MEKDNNKVKYENVFNEEYKIINFNQNQNVEYLLVHDFVNDAGPQYIVVGKFIGVATEIKKNSVMTNYLIKNITEEYKNQEKFRNIMICNNYEQLSFLHNFLFTKEGYDLVTHKFLFTNGDISRTIKIEQIRPYYGNQYSPIIEENNNLFFEFDFLENNHWLNEDEFANLPLNNIIAYVNSNFIKVKNIIENNRSLQNRVDELIENANRIEKIQIYIGALDAINDYNQDINKNKK